MFIFIISFHISRGGFASFGEESVTEKVEYLERLTEEMKEKFENLEQKLMSGMKGLERQLAGCVSTLEKLKICSEDASQNNATHLH